MSEKHIIANKSEIKYNTAEVLEQLNNATIEETIEVVEVDGVNSFSVDVQNAFAALGEPNEHLKHQVLNGRDIPDQHPISAITGLENRLNTIAELKTIHSTSKGIADYYTWEDENPIGENRVGYFVSVCNNTNTIKICTGDDVFGVIVDAAAVIGGQETDKYHYWENHEIYDNKRGLVACAGLVHVRRESNVDVGDYVISNNYGMARKTNGYGFKVIALHNIDGIECAAISLDSFAGQIERLGQSVDDMSVRMDNAEANIIAAINVANKVHNIVTKVEELEKNDTDIIQKVEDAVNKSDGVMDSVDDLNDRLTNVHETVAQAKALADAALLSAETMRNEAVIKANDAFENASTTRKEMEQIRDQIDVQLDGALNDVVNTQSKFNELSKSLTPLTQWQDENSSGIVGFVARADEDAVQLASIVKWQDDTNETISGINIIANDNQANIEALASWKNDNAEAIASTITKATTNEAAIKDIASWQTDTTNNITLIQQTADDNKAQIELLAKSQTDTSDSIVDFKQEVANTYAKIDTLTSYQNSTNSSIASIQQQTDTNGSQITTLTSNQNALQSSMTSITQKASDNETAIQSLITYIHKYSVGEFSQAYGLTQSQATSILHNGMIYIPTVDHSEKYGDLTQNFTIGYYYTWTDDKWIASEAPFVVMSASLPIGGSTLKYWYVNSDTAPEGYEAYALYIWENNSWMKVNTLDGNVNNRITSMIRQSTNEIVAEVVNARGDAASLGARLDSNESSISALTAWQGTMNTNIASIQQTANANSASISSIVSSVGKDGSVTAASIVTAVNNAGSSITLNANKINFSGFTTFLKASDLGESGTTSIDGARITTGIISADRIDADNLKVKAANIDGKLTADQISSDSISTSHLTVGSVIDVIIADGAVTASKVSADIVTANKLETKGGVVIEGSNIKSKTLSADTITAGTLKGEDDASIIIDYCEINDCYLGYNGIWGTGIDITPSSTAKGLNGGVAFTVPCTFGEVKNGIGSVLSNATNKWCIDNKEIATQLWVSQYYVANRELDDVKGDLTLLENAYDVLRAEVTELTNRVNSYHT